jgi:hypothetical protein
MDMKDKVLLLSFMGDVDKGPGKERIFAYMKVVDPPYGVGKEGKKFFFKIFPGPFLINRDLFEVIDFRNYPDYYRNTKVVQVS